MVKVLKVRDYFETYTWCYFYIDEKTKRGFLIDPGAEADKILTVIKENEWTIEKILLTHGHFDHTGAVKEISDKLGIPYLIHRNGDKYLKDTRYNLSSFCDRNIVLNDAEYFEDGDIINIDADSDFFLKVIHTPGHTSDSTVFYNKKDNVAFVGDTLFKGSIGSTQYPGSSMEQLQDSILNRIFRLPEETTLCPGHSEATTVGNEVRRYIR